MLYGESLVFSIAQMSTAFQQGRSNYPGFSLPFRLSTFLTTLTEYSRNLLTIAISAPYVNFWPIAVVGQFEKRPQRLKPHPFHHQLRHG